MSCAVESNKIFLCLLFGLHNLKYIVKHDFTHSPFPKTCQHDSFYRQTYFKVVQCLAWFKCILIIGINISHCCIAVGFLSGLNVKLCLWLVMSSCPFTSFWMIKLKGFPLMGLLYDGDWVHWMTVMVIIREGFWW